MAAKVYIDGHVGTTGLRIRDWLAERRDLELITVPESERKSVEARRECVRASDLTVLCLPDDAAREAASWVRDGNPKLIDASTAHRVAGDWVYGLPELAPGQRDAIRSAPRVSNPGCYASAVILMMRPLIDGRLVDADQALSIHALSGYSGGGRSLIEKWEGGLLSLPYEAPYALGAVHKHIAEMRKYTGAAVEPQFVPAVGPFRCGMRVEIPLHAGVIRGNARAAWEALRDRYDGELFVRVMPFADAAALDERALDPRACNDTNRIDVHVLAHASGHVLLVAILDNLGKGAAGVAIQNLNLMLGVAEGAGLQA